MPKSYSNAELRDLASKLGKSLRTLRYWAAQNCDLEDEESVRRFADHKAIKGRQTAKARVAREQRRSRESVQVLIGGKQVHERQVKPEPRVEISGNGETLEPIGPRGAQHALRRLEEQEERAHARLEAALKRGDPLEIQSCADLWLKTSELLRKLDIAIEVSRRSQEEQIPLKTAQDCVLFVSEWLRISLSTFLSAEGLTLAGGFKTIGELKSYFVSRFRGVMFLTLKNADRTMSPVPPWALERIKIAFNVQDAQEVRERALL
jgi:hypothetical protein